MRRFTIILALLLSGSVFGQSSLFNVPYRPQPRVLIPTVEPSQTLVSTNGAVIANTNRALRYCDFRLVAVDQTGVYTNPILFDFSSVTTNANSAAVVFFQRSGSNWPASLIRRHGSTYIVTNWAASVVTNVEQRATNWNQFISASNYPPNGAGILGAIKWNGYEFKIQTPAYNGKIQFSANPYTQTNGNGYWYRYESNNVWAVRQSCRDYTMDLSPINDNGPIVVSYSTFTNSFVTTTNLAINRVTVISTNLTSEIQSATVMSISQTSINEASAIEVYPIRKGQQWMKQTNPDIKWMCLLSNGREWYSTAAGNPIWVNCQVEWVDKIPTQGAQ